MNNTNLTRPICHNNILQNRGDALTNEDATKPYQMPNKSAELLINIL